MMLIQHILVPVDFSECSRRALAYGVDLAKRYNSTLTIFHVYALPGFHMPEGFIPAPEEEQDLVREQVEDKINQEKQWAEETGAQKLQTLIAHGRADEEILRVVHGGVRDQPIDFIVMGHHGLTGGFPRKSLGSTVESVLGQVYQVPVLTVSLI